MDLIQEVGTMSKTRKDNIEIELKDKNTIYIRDVQADHWMKLDIAGLITLFKVVETVKNKDRDVLEQMRKEYLAELDDIYNEYID
ncbi:hypothetical protein [Methanolobus psychrotolerans]|uniref:hypothetical protein n=1 Tax=Methanolobus psychrotolerans TaxID=1874706 RepID=UPI00101AEB0D|nr:hypothetical protein [Methanolobus psychrotolerans]